MQHHADSALRLRTALCAVAAVVSTGFFVVAALTASEQPRGPLLVYTGSLSVLLTIGTVVLVRRLRAVDRET